MKAAASASMTLDQRANYRRNVAETGAKNVEALAGAGMLNEARELAAKVIEFHDTPETRRMLNERLERSGQGRVLVR